MGSTNAFEAEFRRSLEHHKGSVKDFAWHRLYDTTTFKRVSEGMLAIKNPCDYIAIRAAQFYMFECKSSHCYSSYQLSYVKPHQISMMREWENGGAMCSFIVNNRSRPRHHEAFVIPVGAMEKFFAEGLKSVKWQRMREEFCQLEKEGDKWNLGPLFVGGV